MQFGMAVATNLYHKEDPSTRDHKYIQKSSLLCSHIYHVHTSAVQAEYSSLFLQIVWWLVTVWCEYRNLHLQDILFTWIPVMKQV